jgi:aspartate racemase
MATAYFMQLIIEMTQADTDQQHIETCFYSMPSIPDRTSYILGKSKESPLPALIEVGKKLGSLQVDCIAIPCITAHYFHKELEEQIPVPIINGIKETADYLKENRVQTAGLLATDGTVESRLFQKWMGEQGIQVVTPDELHQKQVMKVIYENVKAGKPVDLDAFLEAASSLTKKGAEVNLLGCTELSVVKRDYPLGAGYLDVLEVLASSAVKRCGTLREEYRQLITNTVY